MDRPPALAVEASVNKPRSGRKVIDQLRIRASWNDGAQFEAVGKRIDELSGLRRFVRSYDNPPPPPLTEAEKLELAELEAWYDAAPDYLKAPRGWYPDFCGGQHREPAYDDPAERRQRLLREHQAPIEVKSAAPVAEPVDEVPPEPVDDDSDEV
jgi:hypothetical protein